MENDLTPFVLKTPFYEEVKFTGNLKDKDSYHFLHSVLNGLWPEGLTLDLGIHTEFNSVVEHRLSVSYLSHSRLFSLSSQTCGINTFSVYISKDELIGYISSALGFK